MSRRRLDKIKRSVEVGPDGLVKEVSGYVEEGGECADACIGDADVEAGGVEGFEGELDEGGAGGWVADVAGEVGYFPGEGRGFGEEGGEVVGVGGEVEVVHGDVAALGEEGEGDGAAYACGAAGDDGCSVEEEVGGGHGGWSQPGVGKVSWS